MTLTDYNTQTELKFGGGTNVFNEEWYKKDKIENLGISLVTSRYCVPGFHQLFGSLNHLSSKASDTLDKKRESLKF